MLNAWRRLWGENSADHQRVEILFTVLNAWRRLWGENRSETMFDENMQPTTTVYQTSSREGHGTARIAVRHDITQAAPTSEISTPMPTSTTSGYESHALSYTNPSTGQLDDWDR